MTCPCCGTDFPWEAGLIEADAKRLGAILGALDPALARAAMAYLRFFKPPKTTLRLSRAIKLLQELAALFAEGTVCQDERTGLRRAAPAAVWVAAIEQMQAQADSLTLPLAGHGYLRKVAFGLADTFSATAERTHEQALRAGERPTPGPASPVEDRLTNELRFIAQMYSYGKLTAEERDQRAADARARLGGAS